jgi:PAS domain S-box-containing protein
VAAEGAAAVGAAIAWTWRSASAPSSANAWGAAPPPAITQIRVQQVAWQAQTPDVILLDVMMPGMDGFEVCRRLRADARTAEMPVILVTALDDQASRIAGIEAGADDFVTKPFNRAELRARVRTITRLNRYARLHHERAKVQQADQRIREQAALIDLDPDAILVLGLDDRVRLWNRGAEQLYGWPSAEALGRPVGDLVRASQADRFAEAARTVRDAGAWRGEVTQQTRGGVAVIVESRWTLLSTDDPRILIVNRDITEKKRDEERWLRAQRLENLGALASGIVHDLNNVLAPILMATDLLRTDPGDPEAPRWLEVIDASAKRGASMVKQILSFARGSGAGKEAVRLQSLVGDVHTMIRDTFPANIECESQVAADLWPAMVDTTQVYQVLLNLAVNARDAMPRGGRLTIDARNATVDDAYARGKGKAQPGPYVAVSVTDTGDGIPAEHIERIFDPFFTTKAADKGTGLGLATVRQVIDDHGGFLEFHSQVGKGTWFTVFLPAVAETQVTDAQAAPAAWPQGNNQLVLFVDDEAAVREITKATLESCGYRVVLAGDGTEAVARFAAHGRDIDLLVTDLQMPYMDGLAAIRAIRRLSPGVPVIAMSGSPDENPNLDRFGPAVQGWLTKPLNAVVLLTEVDRVLHG